jgi:DNA mismatch endonuclease (patch repair protein)
MSQAKERMSRKAMTRSEIMSRVGNKNSAAERALRSALHATGLRFSLHRRVDGIVVDIAFPAPRVLVFVDGCFWHGCPRHATLPKTNSDYWLPKLQENKDRDKRQTTMLRKSGWKVIRVWEHECLPPTAQTVARIMTACRKGDAQT